MDIVSKLWKVTELPAGLIGIKFSSLHYRCVSERRSSAMKENKSIIFLMKFTDYLALFMNEIWIYSKCESAFSEIKLHRYFLLELLWFEESHTVQRP